MVLDKHIQQVSATFDQWASSDRAQNMAEGHTILMKTLLADISTDCHNASILDLGCGTGKFLALAETLGFSFTAGIDASPMMAKTSSQTAPNADIKIGTFESLPWPANHFDFVTSIEALYYCPNPLQVMQEIARVIEPNGRLDVIIDYYAESTGTASWDDGLGFQLTRLSTLEWIALIKTAGFEACQSRRIINPDREQLIKQWNPSVWYPTLESFENYLENGALWLTATP